MPDEEEVVTYRMVSVTGLRGSDLALSLKADCRSWPVVLEVDLCFGDNGYGMKRSSQSKCRCRWLAVLYDPEVMKQCETHQFKGWFYLPESPETQVPGILNWEPSDGATLELIGGVSPEPEYLSNPDGDGCVRDQIVGDVRPGTIYGVSEKGEKFSIWNAQRGSLSAGIYGSVREEFWTSMWVCVGAHVLSPEEASFSGATVALDDLYYLTSDNRFCAPQWAKIEGVDHPREQQDNGTLLLPYIMPIIGGYQADVACGNTTNARYSVATTATRPFISEATEADPGLKLEFMKKRKRSGPVIALNVGAKVSIQFRDNEFGSATDLVERMSPFIDLMRLATFRPCGVESITLEILGQPDAYLLSRVGGTARPNDIHDPSEVIFTFNEVPLSSYLETWEQLTDGWRAEYVWSVLVGLCGYTSKYVEEYVSQSLAAAEGIHQWCLGNTTDQTLNQRLTDLHDRLPKEVQEKLGLKVKNWASWAVWARNHVAHGGTKRRKIIKDSSVLLAVGELAHLVTYLVVLCELGVPIERMLDALNAHSRLLATSEKTSIVNQIDNDPPNEV